jgi:hypothetical protein
MTNRLENLKLELARDKTTKKYVQRKNLDTNRH